MPLVASLIGAVLGAIIAHRFEAAVIGAVIGFVAGYLIDSQRTARRTGSRAQGVAPADPWSLLDPRVAERMRAMEQRIAALEAALAHARREDRATPVAPAAVAPPPRTEAPAAQPPVQPAVSQARVEATSPSSEDGRLATDALHAHTAPSPVPAYGAPRTPARAAHAQAASPLWRFLVGGNTLARIGVIVLFIGVGFLLKYASEHVTIPIELRLAAVALGAVALLVFGWRLRLRRTGYAMTLQGAAVGILYLTVFAALRLYALLPPVAAFALLFWIGALSSFLAIRQDALPLAVLGIVGGFAAPVVTATGGGSHVMLFSYCALLNAAILAIAWFKAWRLLNVVGFACTFVIGLSWGVTAYRPEDRPTTEAFLILFFLFYVAIATLYALRSSLALRRHVDATLVFGTPLVAAGLQSALVHDIPYAMAWSAIGASAIYLALARLVHARGPALRLLVEAFAALGIVFATLAVPLALDARLTAATWALEGAAIVWVGVRQAHAAARVFGLVLQLAAAVAFALGFTFWTERLVGGNLPVLNSDYLGALLIACGALVSARVLSRASAIGPSERALVPLVFAWGVLWWLGAGWHEIDRFIASEPARIASLVAFVAASAAAFAVLAARLGWPMARAPGVALPAVLLAIAAARIAQTIGVGDHLLAGGGYAAWPFALVLQVLLLRHFERVAPAVPSGAIDTGHAFLVWLATLIGADELAWLARSFTGGGAWRIVPWGFAPALALMAIASLATRASWPFGTRSVAYLRAGLAVAAFALLWTIHANVASPGDAAPLPFVPLVNPLDLVQALAFVAIALWLRRMRAAAAGRRTLSADAFGAAAGLILLFWVTCSTLRTLHHYADVPWVLAPLWASRIVQSALSIVWSLFALAAMVVANRRRYRVAWVVGAALLGVVVAKLFVVDLSQVGGIERIVSFIGVGALLLVIGYVAPVPPRQETR